MVSYQPVAEPCHIFVVFIYFLGSDRKLCNSPRLYECHVVCLSIISNTAPFLAYLFHNIYKSQLYLGFDPWGWKPQYGRLSVEYIALRVQVNFRHSLLKCGCQWVGDNICFYFGVAYVFFILRRLLVFAVEPQYQHLFFYFVSKILFEGHIQNRLNW